MPDALSLEDRFVGSLLGQALADGIGAAFEGLSSDLILAQFGRPSDIVPNPPLDTLYYTDDTQMAIVLAEVLCDKGALDDDDHLIHALWLGEVLEINAASLSDDEGPALELDPNTSPTEKP